MFIYILGNEREREIDRERERERERQSMSRECVWMRERDTESEAGSRLWTVSTEPNAGLELRSQPWDHDLSRSWMLKWLSHSGTPGKYLIDIYHVQENELGSRKTRVNKKSKSLCPLHYSGDNDRRLRKQISKKDCKFIQLRILTATLNTPSDLFSLSPIGTEHSWGTYDSHSAHHFSL